MTENQPKYNLFVVSEAIENTGTFVVEFDNLLKNNPDYAVVNKSFVEESLKFPSLLVQENDFFATASDTRIAHLAEVYKFEACNSFLKFWYKSCAEYRQQSINENAGLFAIAHSEQSNELDYPHWEIKEIDLHKALKNLEQKEKAI